MKKLLFRPPCHAIPVVDTGKFCYKSRCCGVPYKVHCLPRHGQTRFNFRTHRHPFNKSSKRDPQIMIQLVCPIIPDAIPQKTRADAYFNFIIQGNSNKNALSTFSPRTLDFWIWESLPNQSSFFASHSLRRGHLFFALFPPQSPQMVMS